MIKEYGYEYDAVLNVELANKTAGQCVSHIDHGAILLRSGRDALKAVAREYRKSVAFLPALSCDSMVVPFRLYSHKISYYRLRNDYSTDFDDLFEMLSKESGTVLLLYMNYFGNLSMIDDQLEYIKKHYPNVVFIEDRTHDLIYERQNSFQPDYIVASLRKWMNVPDGGLLWAYKPLRNTTFSDDTEFSETRRKAQCMRAEFFKNGDESIKTEYRKIFSTVTNQIDSCPLPGRMTEYAYRMALDTNWSAIRDIREGNAAILTETLAGCSKVNFVQTNIRKSNLYVPILIDNRNLIQQTLALKGIFTTLIWPLNKKQKERCETADYTERCMLGIPCDQRYSMDDMRFIAQEIVKTINEQYAKA